MDFIKTHERWRRKQFNIFYGSGRPIFNISTETEHLRSHQNPLYAKDPYIRTVISDRSATLPMNV